MSKSISTWWVLLVTNIIALFWLYYFGILQWVYQTDATPISISLIVLYLGVLLWMPREFSLFRTFDEMFETPLYIATFMPRIGLLGTVIGLYIAVNAMAGVNIDAGNQSQIMGMMSSMFLALSTSLITTIAGLGLGLLLQSQILILETVFKHE